MTPGLQPSVHPMPNSYGVAIGWDGAGPLALKRNVSSDLSFPSSNGAHNPRLGYSPRNWDIETVRGLKARSIRSGQEAQT